MKNLCLMGVVFLLHRKCAVWAPFLGFIMLRRSIRGLKCTSMCIVMYITDLNAQNVQLWKF
jgi:hypothetical protein